MILTRRQFLKASAALVAAPAIVKAENIMKIWVPPEPAARFRVPDLRGHFSQNPEEMNQYGQRENMTATEVLERREAVKATWAKRWGGHMNTEMARKQAQAMAMRNVNEKIDAEIMAKIQGQEITGVWVDEAQNMDMAYYINPKAVGSIPVGSTQAFSQAVPTGWVPCDGRELSAIEYPELHGILGNKYG